MSFGPPDRKEQEATHAHAKHLQRHGRHSKATHYHASSETAPPHDMAAHDAWRNLYLFSLSCWSKISTPRTRPRRRFNQPSLQPRRPANQLLLQPRRLTYLFLLQPRRLANLQLPLRRLVSPRHYDHYHPLTRPLPHFHSLPHFHAWHINQLRSSFWWDSSARPLHVHSQFTHTTSNNIATTITNATSKAITIF